MNENERKFFLRRFFSFNLPSNSAVGSNNASFDDADEQMSAVRVQVNDSSDDALKGGQATTTARSSDFSYLIDNRSSSSKKSVLEDIKEQHSQDASLENEKLIKDKDKKVDFGTISRRNKFKKSTDSSQRLILASSYSLAANSDYNLAGQERLQPTIDASHDRILKDDSASEKSGCNNNSNKSSSSRNLFQDSNQLQVKARGQLQEQYSIELKPFKKKEVQIDLSSVVDGSATVLIESLPNIDVSKSVISGSSGKGTVYYNYPSVEFPSQQAVVEAKKLTLKYRLGP